MSAHRDLEAENFRLAAGQCVVENGLIGDEHGHFGCSLLRLLREQHDAMSDIMELRRMSSNQTQRDKAESAIAVWHRVEAAITRARGAA